MGDDGCGSSHCGSVVRTCSRATGYIASLSRGAGEPGYLYRHSAAPAMQELRLRYQYFFFLNLGLVCVGEVHCACKQGAMGVGASSVGSGGARLPFPASCLPLLVTLATPSLPLSLSRVPETVDPCSALPFFLFFFLLFLMPGTIIPLRHPFPLSHPKIRTTFFSQARDNAAPIPT